MKKIFVLLTLALFGLAACQPQEPLDKWGFTCADGYRFEIEYSEDGKEALMMSEEGVAKLKIARSGSGARYTDGNLVFWNKGNSAFLEMNEKIIHSDCEGVKVTGN